MSSDQVQNIRSSTEEKSSDSGVSMDVGVPVVKKYRKVRDFFGKRSYSTMEGESSEADKSSDEDSSDSGAASPTKPSEILKAKPASVKITRNKKVNPKELPSTAAAPLKRARRGPSARSTPNNNGPQNAIAGPSTAPVIPTNGAKEEETKNEEEVGPVEEKVMVEFPETENDSKKRIKWETDFQKMVQRRLKKANAIKKDDKAEPDDDAPKKTRWTTSAAAAAEKKKEATPAPAAVQKKETTPATAAVQKKRTAPKTSTPKPSTKKNQAAPKAAPKEPEEKALVLRSSYNREIKPTQRMSI